MQVTEGGAGGSASGELPVPCPAFRDQPGETALAITIRNERATHIYLQPFRGECENTPGTLVDFQRGSEVVNVRGFAPGFCEAFVCQDIQDNGLRESVPCIGSCPQLPSLVRLEPGAELQIGGAWNEFVSHGILLPSARMPNACYGGQSNDSFPSDVECYSQRPLPEGEYRIVARAFLEVECPNDGPPCDCVPDATGSCTTGAAFGRGEAPLRSFTVTQVPAANVTLTFQSD
jgi:hypothetical protein